MRISKLRIQKDLTDQKGLKEIKLTNKPLGSTIALVGKNGAGKSRILKLVETYLSSISQSEFDEKYITNIPSTISDIFQIQINDLEARKKNHPKNSPQIKQIENQIKAIRTNFYTSLKQVGQSYIKIVDNDDLKIIKNDLEQKQSLSFDQILSNVHFDNFINSSNSPQNNKKPSNPNLNEFSIFNSQSTLKYIHDLTNRVLTEQINIYLEQPDNLEVINAKLKQRDSYKLLCIFQNYIKQFLGKSFSYKQNTKGNIIDSTLFFNDTPFDISQLSPGEKTLFAYAILFFYLDVNQKSNIKDSIIIIDEPEKHLHPDAQIRLLNALKEIISESGQLWLATHSINILAHLDYDEILMVKENELILPSRNTPGKSFIELMGIDSHISELNSFIGSISEWAFGSFMAQCFRDPDSTFNNDINDPQYRLFKEFIVKNPGIKLLDFGAGKGRLGYTISEDLNIRQKLEYYAFEPNNAYFKTLSSVPVLKQHYSSLNEIPEDFFDIVLLCNVLHEINPKDWIDNFHKIKSFLNIGGYLIIMEDLLLPKGENAHQFGYLVLNSNHLDIMFQDEDNPNHEGLKFLLKEEELKDRIILSAFKKDNINISMPNIKAALKSLKDDAFLNIKKLRKGQKDLNIGRLYANQTQLYINAQLVLDDLK